MTKTKQKTHCVVHTHTHTLENKRIVKFYWSVISVNCEIAWAQNKNIHMSKWANYIINNHQSVETVSYCHTFTLFSSCVCVSLVSCLCILFSSSFHFNFQFYIIIHSHTYAHTSRSSIRMNQRLEIFLVDIVGDLFRLWTVVDWCFIDEKLRDFAIECTMSAPAPHI